MREKLIELLDNVQYQGNATEVGINYIQNGDIADYLLEKGVVVLPIKIRDTVYTTYGGNLSKYEVKSLVINDFCWAKLFNEEYVAEYKLIKSCISFDLGRTVFLTKEEAEKALERSKQ